MKEDLQMPALSREQSAYSRSLQIKQLSAIGRERSVYSRRLQAMQVLIAKAYNLIPERSAYSRRLQVVEAMVCRPLSRLSGRKSANHQPGPRNPLTAGGQPVSDSCAPAYSRRLQGLKPKTQYLKPERSALGCRPQSAVSREPSAYGRSLEGLKPNTHYLIPKRSAYRRSLQALLALKPNTQYLIPFIIFIFVSCDAAMAQEPSLTPAAEAVAEITPLEVGDRVPEELWQMPLQVVNHSEGKESITLNDYRDQLIILDFWATWCGSCISSLHELGGLQEQFKGDLQVVPIAYEPKSKVEPFLTKQEIGLPSIIEDKELKGYFPHNSVPHQVWIKDNAVRAIVRHEETSAENIEKLLAGGDIRLQGKKDILDYDAFSNILEYAERTETPVLSTSSFTRRIEGLPASTGTRSEGGLTVVNYTNVNPLLMYSRAMGVRNNRIIVNSENLKKAANIDADTRNRYSYQLVISGDADERIVNRRVLSDLNAQFDVRVDSQIVDMDCYVISQISEGGDDPLPDAAGSRSSGNGKISHEFTTLVNLLNFSIKWTADQPIFIDRSGFRGKVEAERYEVLQKDVDRLKLALIPHGLTVTREKQPIKMYVINDADQDDAAN